MLDAIAQTLAEQAAKPAVPATIDTPKAALVVPQETAVPIPQPTVSAPESLPPAFLLQSAGAASTPSPAAQPALSVSNPTGPSTDVPAVSHPKPNAQPLPNANSQAATVASPPATERATAEQRLILKQRLAELVAKEKPLKEAKLRANLEAMAIASAKAGDFLQARRLAQDLMLSPEQQADLLAQIEAIEVATAPTKSVSTPKQLRSKSSPSVIEPQTPTVSGRSLPSVLPYTPPPETIPYSVVPQSPPEYVSYSLNSFGRTIGGFGVVVDDTATAFNGQSWMTAYATGNGFNTDLWNGLSLIFPLAMPAPITSGFGWRVHPIKGDRRFHQGTDLGAPMGTPVLAAAAGKVALSDWLNGYGLAIILSHQNDTQETLYGHLSQVFVKPGQWVEKGTIIGRVGSTGLSTGPHLHFELRQKTPNGWQAIDPGAQLKYALARLVKAMQAAG